MTSKTTHSKAADRRLMIIDGNAIIHRSFHALPPLATKDGVLVNAVYGFITTLFKAIKDLKPTHIAVTFDMAGPTFRHDESADYKAKRVKQAPELYAQIPITKEVLAALDIKVFEKQGFEADDVIGTIATIARREKPSVETTIVTGDLDALQLINDTTKVYTMRRGLNDTIMYDAAAVHERFGFGPEHVVDYKALRGDTSDNISGVRGIGEKTGMELVKKFGSIEKMYAALEKGGKIEGVTDRIQKLLIEKKADAVQSKHLATIVCDVPFDFSFDDCRYTPSERDVVFPVFQKLGFISLLQRMPMLESGATSVATASSEPVAAKKKSVMTIAKDISKTRTLIEKLSKEQKVATFFLKPQQQDLFGVAAPVIGFAWNGGHTAAIEINSEQQWDEIGRLILDKKVAIIAHDVKQLMHELAVHGIAVGGEIFDVMIAAYLLQAGTRAHDLPNLVITILGEDVPVSEWAHGDPTRAGRGAERVWRIAEKLQEEMREKKLEKLFDEIEMPLVGPLTRMERYGIELDQKFLKKLDDQLSDRLEKISKKIYKMAGREFNIASPQQVSTILFEDLKISSAGVKRGKTGLSTAAGELEKLQGTNEIVDSILEHREISKLLNTYVQALPKLVATDGRVHTSYNQAVAATGRLSSSNPNLQNIPVRTELGRDIRRAFVAADGYKLLSCDYSQIELRIVAHLANDQKLTLSEVTKEMRSAAKEVNFGVLYGMGAWGLAERTGISNYDARAFIEKYFATFTGVAAYVESIKKFARENGYVETIFGRRRYVPEMTSGVGPVRAAGERMAVNMPIQGTQADIVKKAMIAVDEFLVREYGFGFAMTEKEKKCPVRVLLQVHDELIFEVKEDLVTTVAPQIIDIMSGVAHLKVPLKVDSAVGENWGQLD
ncbi:MAG: DNA polymerase I [Candidatus Magasanikbacteria bacterium]|nr:DNA polymerase I [Candidatus Magasanikbacteria bacterium]